MTTIYRMQWQGLHTMTEQELDEMIRAAREDSRYLVQQWHDTDASGVPVTLTRIDAKKAGTALELVISYPSARFDLFITTATGRHFKALRSPYGSRAAAGTTARGILRAAPGYNGDPGSLTATVQAVTRVPLGHPVIDEATGITFRTESAT